MFRQTTSTESFVLPADSVDLTQYSPSELRALRRRIDRLLPHQTIDTFDLVAELISQYNGVKDDLETVVDETKKATLYNSATSLLKQIVEQQNQQFSPAKLQALENVLIDTLKKFPEMQTEFLSEYRKALNPDQA